VAADATPAALSQQSAEASKQRAEASKPRAAASKPRAVAGKQRAATTNLVITGRATLYSAAVRNSPSIRRRVEKLWMTRANPVENQMSQIFFRKDASPDRLGYVVHVPFAWRFA
jgi:hypothetical protein